MSFAAAFCGHPVNNTLNCTVPTSFSRIALYLVFVVMAVTSLIRNEVFTGKTNVINWDGYGYYVYLPAIFIYGDTDDYAFVDEHFANYKISSDAYQLMTAEDGSKFPIYNIGQAVVWTPAFLVTHAIVKATGVAAPDGMSYPYQLMVVLMSLLVILLGFRRLRRFLLAYFPDWVVAVTLLGTGLGTNLFYYVVEKPDMTHGYLFAGYAVLLYQFQKILEEEKSGYPIKKLLGLGLLAGMLCLIRSSEIVLFAIPAFYGLRNWSTFKHNFRRTLPVFLVALAVVSLQFIFYKTGTGQWFRDGYAGLGFDWAEPHLYDGLFGYRRGWLVYTPLMAFALLGIGWLKKGWLLPVLIFTAANLYLLFSWHIWWYGNTFGSRPVVQSYAVLALPLAAFVAWLGGAAAGAKQWIFKAVTGALLTAFIALNLFQHWQYNQRIIPLDFTNQTYYWEVFGKTTLDKKDRVLLDTDEQLPAGEWSASLLLRSDTLITAPAKASREFTNLMEYRTGPVEVSETWLRSQLVFSYHGTTYDKWKFPSVVTEHRRGNETLKWLQVKVPPVIETPELDSVRFSISLPGWRKGDVVKQYLWNLSQDSMVVYRYEATLLSR